MNTKYSKYNFYKNTFCEFQEVNVEQIAKLEIHYKSRSGSGYIFSDEGVYRISNHWGRAANCRWRLISCSNAKINNCIAKIGYAKWTDFYENNETDKLFFIQVDYETKEVIFQHKNSATFNSKAIVRNASETAKIIRQIHDVFNPQGWTNYLSTANVQAIRNEVVKRLIQTNIPLHKIKTEIIAEMQHK